MVSDHTYECTCICMHVHVCTLMHVNAYICTCKCIPYMYMLGFSQDLVNELGCSTYKSKSPRRIVDFATPITWAETLMLN